MKAVNQKEQKPRVFERILAALQKAREEGNDVGFLLVGTVTEEEFEHFLEKEEDCTEFSRQKPGKIRYLWKDNKLFITLETGTVHAAILGELAHRLYDSHWSNLVDVSLRALGNGAFNAQPDLSFRPNALVLPPGAHSPTTPGRKPWPTVVVEVGVSQSLSELNQKAQMWLQANTGVQIVLIFKFYKKFNNGNQGMVALQYHRGTVLPVFTVSFGTSRLKQNVRAVLPGGAVNLTGVGESDANGVPYPACNSVGIPDYQFRVPTVLAFAGVPGGVPGGLGANIMLDLFQIQQRVFAEF
jgi:hypothetical protein